jgi:hypothetical protein
MVFGVISHSYSYINELTRLRVVPGVEGVSGVKGDIVSIESEDATELPVVSFLSSITALMSN